MKLLLALVLALALALAVEAKRPKRRCVEYEYESAPSTPTQMPSLPPSKPTTMPTPSPTLTGGLPGDSCATVPCRPDLGATCVEVPGVDSFCTYPQLCAYRCKKIGYKKCRKGPVKGEAGCWCYRSGKRCLNFI